MNKLKLIICSFRGLNQNVVHVKPLDDKLPTFD